MGERINSILNAKSSNTESIRSKLELFRDLVNKNTLLTDNKLITNLARRYTNVERQVEEIGYVPQSILLTSYFTSKPNPQKELHDAPPDDINYIKPWYDSVNKLDLFGVVFYDNLSEDFVNRYSTKNVIFLKCTIGKLSLNDERFLIYLIFLLKYVKNIESVFMSDSRDVTITRNPFEIIAKYPDHTIFCGRNNGNLIRQSAHNVHKTSLFEKDTGEKVENNFYNLPVYNAGILGGRSSTVIHFLMQMAEYLLKANSDLNHNMIVFNYTIFKHWGPKTNRGWRRLIGRLFNLRLYRYIKRNRNKWYLGWAYAITKARSDHDNRNDRLAVSDAIFTSYPLCSAYKKFETNSDAYFIHK